MIPLHWVLLSGGIILERLCSALWHWYAFTNISSGLAKGACQHVKGGNAMSTFRG